MAIAILFEVEFARVVFGKAHVFAAQLGSERGWAVAPGATLGGCPIAPALSMPRALDADGKPRLDLFVFVLVNEADVAEFEIGRRVELVCPDAQ